MEQSQDGAQASYEAGVITPSPPPACTHHTPTHPVWAAGLQLQQWCFSFTWQRGTDSLYQLGLMCGEGTVSALLFIQGNYKEKASTSLKHNLLFIYQHSICAC